MKTPALLSLLAASLIAAIVTSLFSRNGSEESVDAHAVPGRVNPEEAFWREADLAPSAQSSVQELPPTSSREVREWASESVAVDALSTESTFELIVVTRSGIPVSGATVQVTLRRHGELAGEKMTRHQYGSDGLGRVSFTAAPPLATGALNASIVAWKNELFGEHTIPTLFPEEQSRHEVVVDPTVVVQGLVTDQLSGTPVRDAEVHISTLDRDVRTRTDSSGRYSVSFPAQDTGHAISFRSPTHGKESIQVVASPEGLCLLQFPKPERAEWRPSPLEVDVQLPGALEVVGSVADTTGTPLVGATVTAKGYYKMAGGIGFPDTSTTTSGTNGEFRLQGLRADISHQLVVTLDGFGTLFHEVPADASGRMECGQLVLSEAVPVAGVVLDHMGFPAEGLEVEVASQYPRSVLTESVVDSETQRDSGLRVGLSRTARTSRDGTFSFEQCPTGDYAVYVSELYRRVAEKHVTIEPGMTTGGLEIQLPPTEGVLEGRVLKDSQPASSATVVLSYNGWKRFVHTDAHGRFRLAGVRLDAPHTLQAFLLDSDGRVYAQSPSSEVWAFDPPVELELEEDA